MKALVMGGSRFFGRRLVQRLLDDGVEVTVLNRGRRPDGFGDRVTRIVADRTELPDEALGEGRWNIIYDQICYDADEAERACEIFDGRVDHYVLTSSVSVYTEAAQNIAETAFDPRSYEFDRVVHTTENYAEGKRQAETTFAKLATFPCTMVRFPIVIGVEDYTGRLEFHIDHILENRAMKIPNPEARMTYVSASDAAEFLFWLRGRIGMGPINVASPEPISIGALVSLIEKTLDKRAEISAEGDPSPYGVPADWYVSVERMQKLGFDCKPLMSWLPQLISQLSDSD